MNGRPSRRWLSALLLIAGLSSSCGRESAVAVDVDLASEWSSALVALEPAHMDVGTVDARSHLAAGWYYDERNRASGETFVWSRGASSEVDFHLGWRRDLRLDFRCRPFQFPGAPPQTLSFELNGHSLGDGLELQPLSKTYSIVLPATAQIFGRNRLVVRYGRVDSPSAVIAGSTDERKIAVAWSEMVLDVVDETAMRSNDGVVEMPAGSLADHFVELAPGSLLQIEDCRPQGAGPSVLEVSILGEFETEPETSSWGCSGGGHTLPLGDREGLSRLRLTTRPKRSGGAPQGLRLVRPRILSPQGPQSVGNRPESVDTRPRKTAKPNVIIYLVDALRADRLGIYGCDRPLTPRLDAMAAQGITFTDMAAQSSWTKAAVASVFTGLWPRAHGVNGPDDRLPDGLPTLPERLQAAGYQTGAVVANAYVGRPFGFARGFDHFEFIEHARGRSEVIHERVSRWLDARTPGDGPFFLYVHTIDPHAPYAPPSPYLEAFASAVEDPSIGQVETVRGLVLGTVEPTVELGRDLRNLYDAEVAANDASFGRLLDKLDALGELENTVVIFTSDHGEAFGEHGSWTHGLDLYDEVLSVPLVIRLPGAAGAGQRVSTPVQHIDLLPTIMGLCGIDPSGLMPGAALLDGEGALRVRDDRTIFVYLDYWGKTGAAALRDGWKLIQPLSPDFGPRIELYRHDEDRAEAHDLADSASVRLGWLLAQLEVASEGEGISLPTEVDEETRAQLEALGYMH